MRVTLKTKDRSGFTLAEMLMAIAIILILGGISAVAVIRHQRDLRLLEMDNIAKDIFITAQNHLSEAQALGRIDVESHTAFESGKAEQTAATDILTLKVSDGSATLDKEDPTDYYSLLLPFGAIDDTIRNQSYTIRFDPVTATVLEVFYSDNYDVGSALYSNLEAVKDNKDARKRYDGNHIIGYYGNTNGLDKKPVLAAPRIIIHNEEILYVEVIVSDEFFSHFNYDDKTSLKVFFTDDETKPITATTSNSKKEDGRIFVVLDDITVSDNRIQNHLTLSELLGKDLKLRVEISDSENFANTASSPESESFNSLFGGLRESEDGITVANFRHLENLGNGSGFSNSGGELTISQSDNLEWEDFKEKVTFLHDKLVTGDSPAKEAIEYIPPVLEYPLTYHGGKLYIDGVENNSLGSDAGLFGEATTLTVDNLELRNFNLHTTSGDAGALVGTATTVTLTNVIAYNTESVPANEAALSITTTGGNAGGLIGRTNGATITGSAAAVYVQGTTSAGGLVGSVTTGSITASYAGGHTDQGVFRGNEEGVTSTTPGRPNVQSTGSSGGLIGTVAAGVTLNQCYATTSVSGPTVDELANGIEYDRTKNYGAGWKFDIDEVNVKDADRYPDLSLDQDFAPAGTTTSYNYDAYWDNEKFPYKTTFQLGGTSTLWFQSTHVGDWAYPGPVIEAYNQKN
ncbi:MAG: prepilin-type N-terminal cleavage/methylation domain-containing protein [Solobacterium sp.]|nr:prepilin-type N-terminal cleavage/methylation domain-containing protein [Solobacterium sp.]